MANIKHKWSAEKAKRIEKLAMIGCNDNHIAAIEEIPERSLLRHYKKELSEGRAKGTGAVAQTLYQMALSGKNPAATFFYLKCRARWQEVQRIEHSGPDGKPMEVKAAPTLTKEQIKQAAKEIADESD